MHKVGTDPFMASSMSYFSILVVGKVIKLFAFNTTGNLAHIDQDVQDYYAHRMLEMIHDHSSLLVLQDMVSVL